MKKRSACKLMLGAVVLCGLSTGQCGTVTLQGTVPLSMRGKVVIHGGASERVGERYGLGIGCSVCAGFHGPCESTTPSNINVTGLSNAAKVRVAHAGNGVGFAGTYVFWDAASRGRDSWVSAEYTCDNRSRPDWGWVNVGYFRTTLEYSRDIYLVATNYETGETLENRPGRTDWRPWRTVCATDGGVTSANISVSYPEQVVLRGKGAMARVLYDVKGNSPLYVQIDNIPKGLSCKRLSDGVIVDLGVSSAVGVGDSIACTNVQNTTGETSGALSITAMVR